MRVTYAGIPTGRNAQRRVVIDEFPGSLTCISVDRPGVASTREM
jgi:hypothetical protein